MEALNTAQPGRPVIYEDYANFILPQLRPRQHCDWGWGRFSPVREDQTPVRAPGEGFSEHILTSAIRNTSIADRVVAAFKRGMAKTSTISLTDALPKNIGSGLDELFKYAYDSIAFSNLGSFWFLSGYPLLLARDLAKFHVRIQAQDGTVNKNRRRNGDCYSEVNKITEAGGHRESEAMVSISTIEGILTADELKTMYEVPQRDVDGITWAPLGSEEVIDLRLTTSDMEDVHLRHGPAMAARLAIHIDAAVKSTGRFGILYSCPYFGLTELVKLDNRMYLPIDELYSAKVEPAEPNIKSRPLPAILTALHLSHLPDYQIECQATKCCKGCGTALESSRTADRWDLIRTRIMNLTQPGQHEDHGCSNGPVGNFSSDSKTSRSDKYLSFVFPTIGDSVPSDADPLLFLKDEEGTAIFVRYVADSAIICDDASLKGSRMLALEIQLELDSDVEAESSSPSSPADSSEPKQSASQPSVYPLRPLVRSASPFDVLPWFRASTSTHRRLDLIERIGEGHSGVVWSARWAIESSEDGGCEGDVSNTGPIPHSSAEPKLVVKIVPSRFVSAVIREYFACARVVPKLSPAAQALFRKFYGLYRTIVRIYRS
ncbi:BQ2448_3820 [Microbotryum intermedium]|uniref:BQ2448_3820 protein n=1 Tax=Microbotryum intermedium TaxID=269621 RepID=A0A238FIP7_9BASI|nr:BQ2448_3820 [Microbotryum intermedium]